MGEGLISEKTEVLYAELYEKVKAATGKYPVTGDFLQYIYSLEHPINVFSSWVFIHICFLTIFIMVTEQLY